MSPLPNPFSSGISADAMAKANPTLATGLKALEIEDYETAIANLTKICEEELHEPIIIRAKIALVIAYDRRGEIAKAKEICQNLSKDTNPKVRQWALRSLVELSKNSTANISISNPNPENPDPSGFVPLSTNPPKNNKNKNENFQVSTNKQRSLDANQDNTQNLPNKNNNTNLVTSGKAEKSNALTSNTLSEYKPTGRNGGRAKKWSPLRSIQLNRLWAVQIITAILLIFTLIGVLQLSTGTANNLIVQIIKILSIFGIYNLTTISLFYTLYYYPLQPVLICLAIFLVTSPWLLDIILKYIYGIQDLSNNTLANYSSEAEQLVNKFCRQKKLKTPKLKILPIETPIAFSYGNLPHTARIVISQGILEKLEADEIAAIYATELGHILNWDFVLISLGLIITQIPFIIYWQISQWGNNQHPIIKNIAIGISTISYGLYWILRLPILWLAKARIYYSDRIAAETTGNPNGLSRALIKISIDIAASVKKQGETNNILEGFDFILPVGKNQAINFSSLSEKYPIESLLAWEIQHPYKQWINILNSHPLLGERLKTLSIWAEYWKLETELDFHNLKIDKSGKKSENKNQEITLLQPHLLWEPQHKKLLLQIAPFWGLMVGVSLGIVIWAIGWIAILLRINLLSWLYFDRWWFITGLVMAGFSIGTIARINAFFPDIKILPTANADIAELLTQPNTLAIDSQAIRLEGKLIGRRGILNILGQDLMLETPTGLIKLHWFSRFGPIGNIWLKNNHPREFIGKQAIVIGWWRRDTTPWVDVEILRNSQGRTLIGGHQIWSTIIAIATGLWAAYIILKGGM